MTSVTSHRERNVIHVQLRQNVVLKEMTDVERAELERHLDVVDCNKGDHLLDQGVHEMEQYFVLDGILKRVVTNAEADRGAFRTPTLRNARSTAPYFHDGSVSSLEAAVRSELAVDGVVLDEADVEALVSFIGRGLVDVTNDPDRPDVVPSGLPVPTDGFRIVRQ